MTRMQSVFQDLNIVVHAVSRRNLDQEWRTENFAKRYRIVPWSRFYFPLDGEAHYWFDGHEYTLRHGKFLLIPPLISTRAWCDEFCDLCWMNFNAFPGGGGVDLFSLFHPPWEFPVSDLAFSQTAFFRMLDCQKELDQCMDSVRHAAIKFEQESLARLLLLPFFTAAEQTRGDGEDLGTFFKLLTHIEAHLDQNDSLESLGRQCGMSPTYLTNLFSSRIGLPLIRYRNMRRLTRAVHLFETTDMTISEISYSLGFTTPNNFARLFKRHYGCSPQKYRKEL